MLGAAERVQANLSLTADIGKGVEIPEQAEAKRPLLCADDYQLAGLWGCGVVICLPLFFVIQQSS